MVQLSISQLAPIGVSLLIIILAYGSQFFFAYIEPYALERQQVATFNLLVGCVWVCYVLACQTDPGRVPKDWTPDGVASLFLSTSEDSHVFNRYRWCKKCEAFKPPRAHHCKTCQRYPCHYDL